MPTQYNSQCEVCMRKKAAKQKAWRDKVKYADPEKYERIRLQRADYRLKNKERIKAYNDNYQEKKKGKITNRK